MIELPKAGYPDLIHIHASTVLSMPVYLSCVDIATETRLSICNIIGMRLINFCTVILSLLSKILQDTLRVIFEINDEDIDPITNALSIDAIAPMTFREIFQPTGINPEFQTLSVAGAFTVDLNITFDYRLICTPGSCGSDCSQTNNCPSFPAACPVACSDAMPCLNGGSCQVGVRKESYIGILVWYTP